MSGSCFTTPAVILASDLFFLCIYFYKSQVISSNSSASVCSTVRSSWAVWTAAPDKCTVDRNSCIQKVALSNLSPVTFSPLCNRMAAGLHRQYKFPHPPFLFPLSHTLSLHHSVCLCPLSSFSLPFCLSLCLSVSLSLSLSPSLCLRLPVFVTGCKPIDEYRFGFDSVSLFVFASLSLSSLCVSLTLSLSFCLPAPSL